MQLLPTFGVFGSTAAISGTSTSNAPQQSPTRPHRNFFWLLLLTHTHLEHLSVMPVLDRTNEFRACVDSISKRSAVIPSRNAEQKQRLLSRNNPGASGGKSEFARMAGGIGKDITNTTLKLSKLAQRMYGSSLFAKCLATVMFTL